MSRELTPEQIAAALITDGWTPARPLSFALPTGDDDAPPTPPAGTIVVSGSDAESVLTTAAAVGIAQRQRHAASEAAQAERDRELAEAREQAKAAKEAEADAQRRHDETRAELQRYQQQQRQAETERQRAEQAKTKQGVDGWKARIAQDRAARGKRPLDEAVLTSRASEMFGRWGAP